MKLYRELASWWPLVSAPAEYAEEAAIAAETMQGGARGPVRRVLELGCGGGNNASHLKARFEMTLSDLSPGMLDVSRALNPGCEHVRGDMRTLRLGRTFDAVFVHDAVMYLTRERDLRAAVVTAYEHLRPGGVALFVPDDVKETWRPVTKHGGHDGDGRALRYLVWSYDPDPGDTTGTRSASSRARRGCASSRRRASGSRRCRTSTRPSRPTRATSCSSA
jgi:SAM-dependent methyltransferase